MKRSYNSPSFRNRYNISIEQRLVDGGYKFMGIIFYNRDSHWEIHLPDRTIEVSSRNEAKKAIRRHHTEARKEEENEENTGS